MRVAYHTHKILLSTLIFTIKQIMRNFSDHPCTASKCPTFHCTSTMFFEMQKICAISFPMFYGTEPCTAESLIILKVKFDVWDKSLSSWDQKLWKRKTCSTVTFLTMKITYLHLNPGPLTPNCLRQFCITVAHSQDAVLENSAGVAFEELQEREPL